MFRAILALASTVLLLAPGAGAAPTGGTPPAADAGAAIVETPLSPQTASPGRPVYGPIRAEDPAVRAQIKQLYVERSRIEEVARVELAELAGQLGTETDADFRWELHQRIIGVKLDLRLHTMELGLEIARLDGDGQRVAEYELALDQLRHPEKYRPAPADPAIQQEKMHTQGLEARDAQ